MWGETPAGQSGSANRLAAPPAPKEGAVKPVWVTDAVFIVAPVAAVAMSIWGHVTGDQALAVITAAMGYAAGRPVSS